MELTIIISALIAFLEIMGVVSAIDAIMKSRTSQGAVAWVIALIAMPILVVPLYWILGRNKFKGYVKLRNSTDVQVRHLIDRAKTVFEEKGVIDATDDRNAMVLEQISDMPLTRFNSVDLLIDGHETFASIFRGIDSARKRIWIASPYFVPDRQTITALQLAALRGVDVRILLPEKPDHLLVYLASFSFYRETLPVGIRLYRYKAGFMHQKVMLVDDNVSAVGTANFDNRSFRLNFEITLIFYDRQFAGSIEEMLVNDFASSRKVTMADIENRFIGFKVSTRLARLMSPIL